MFSKKRMKINWDINILYLMSLISEEKISMNDNNSYNNKDIQALMAKVKSDFNIMVMGD